MPMLSSDRKKYASAHRVAKDAALLAAALMLSYLEHLIPLGSLIAIPGFKPGFANIVTVLAFSLLSPWDAFAVSMLRVGITGVLFGSLTTFLFSLGGACFAFLGLLLSRLCLRRCSYIGVSVLCAAMHNLGQLLVLAGMVFIPNRSTGTVLAVPALILPFLLPAAVVCGVLTGILLNLLAPRMEGRLQTWKNA